MRCILMQSSYNQLASFGRRGQGFSGKSLAYLLREHCRVRDELRWDEMSGLNGHGALPEEGEEND